MSQPKYTKPEVSEIKFSAREFYNFRNLAIQNNNVPFTVYWNEGKAIVNVETGFLLAFGYIDQIEF